MSSTASVIQQAYIESLEKRSALNRGSKSERLAQKANLQRDALSERDKSTDSIVGGNKSKKINEHGFEALNHLFAKRHSQPANSSELRDKFSEQQRSIEEAYGLTNVSIDASADTLGMKLFKTARRKEYLDDLIQINWQNRPHEPGPINPHMLALKSLFMMREFSQAYLEHFVTYLDTILFLEKEAAELSKVSKN